MKDRLAIDRARYHTLANEFKTGTFEGFPMLHVVQWATPNGPKAGPFRTIGVITAFSLALVFGLIVAVLIEIMKVNKDRIKP
jgi:hypothetical protein